MPPVIDRSHRNQLDTYHRRWPHRFLSRRALPIAGLVLIMGCAPTSRLVFRATDTSFKFTPGPTPRVYVEASLAEVPQSKMRSVGIMEITVSKKKGLERAIELAAQKGRELGCWVVIEHSSFEKLQSRASLAFGARITLVHGAHPAVSHTRAPATLTAEFDCVVRAPDGAAGSRAAAAPDEVVGEEHGSHALRKSSAIT